MYQNSLFMEFTPATAICSRGISLFHEPTIQMIMRSNYYEFIEFRVGKFFQIYRIGSGAGGQLGKLDVIVLASGLEMNSRSSVDGDRHLLRVSAP